MKPAQHRSISDTRFDGKHLYLLMSRGNARPLYDIRGQHIVNIVATHKPEYEIRGDFIHVSGASRPIFRIDGNKIRKVHSTSQAIYEIR
jgi:hypothetical protein